MEFRQQVGCIGYVVNVVFLQELSEKLFTLLLQLTAVTTQNSQNLTLGLSGGYEVNP